jgi:hypothetical protein
LPPSRGPVGRTGALVGDYPSPDRRYVALVTHEEANVGAIAVLTRATHRRVLRRLWDLESFVWVPHRGHRLVVATSGLYGRAGIYLWEGGSQWRNLVRVRRPLDEQFLIHGVTRDGQWLAYGHDSDVEVSSRRMQENGAVDPLLRPRRWLRLPSSPPRGSLASRTRRGRRSVGSGQ